MAWQEPFTNWGAGSVVTYDDMNRICGNLNYLLDSQTLRTNWTDANYVYLTDWRDIVSALAEVQAFLGMDENVPDDSVTSYNFNLIETFCAEVKDEIDRIKAQRYANKYAGEIYTDEQYSGGFENV